MKGLIKYKKRSNIYIRPICATTDINEFKNMTEKYRRYRRIFLVNENRYNSITGEQIRYSYLELRTINKVYRYMSYALPHYEELGYERNDLSR